MQSINIPINREDMERIRQQIIQVTRDVGQATSRHLSTQANRKNIVQILYAILAKYRQVDVAWASEFPFSKKWYVKPQLHDTQDFYS